MKYADNRYTWELTLTFFYKLKIEISSLSIEYWIFAIQQEAQQYLQI